MDYTVKSARSAERDFERLPPEVKPRIAARIRALATAPRPPGCKKMAGAEDRWRVREGDYRIIYEIFDSELIVLVVKIAHRKDVYR